MSEKSQRKADCIHLCGDDCKTLYASNWSYCTERASTRTIVVISLHAWMPLCFPDIHFDFIVIITNTKSCSMIAMFKNPPKSYCSIVLSWTIGIDYSFFLTLISQKCSTMQDPATILYSVVPWRADITKMYLYHFTAPCVNIYFWGYHGRCHGQEYVSVRTQESTGTLGLGDYGMMQNLAEKLQPNKSNNNLTVKQHDRKHLHSSNTFLVLIPSLQKSLTWEGYRHNRQRDRMTVPSEAPTVWHHKMRARSCAKEPSVILH